MSPLVIRKQQLDALARIPRLEFETQLIKRFSHYYPKECERAGAPQVRKLVQEGIVRAAAHGYHAQREAGLYIQLMLILGYDFDRDPQIPWAAEQVNDAAIADPFARIQRLMGATLDYLEQTGGPENGHMVRALIRIRDYDLATAPQSSGVRLQEDLHALFNRFFPQKYAFQGRDVLHALIERGMEAAWDFDLRCNKGTTVYTTLMFMLGSGIDRDPMYPWVGRVLADRSIPSGVARARRLHREAVAYVNQALQ